MSTSRLTLGGSACTRISCGAYAPFGRQGPPADRPACSRPQPVQAGTLSQPGASTDWLSRAGDGRSRIPEQRSSSSKSGRFLASARSMTGAAAPGGRVSPARPATCCSSCRGAWEPPQWSNRSRCRWCRSAVGRPGAAPKVAELPVTLQRDRTPYNMVMGMSFVDVGTDHKGVLAFGEPPGKFYAQPVGFLRRDLARPKDCRTW